MKNSKPISGFSSWRMRLGAAGFVAIAPALAFGFYTRQSAAGVAAGLVALAIWFTAQRFVLDDLRRLLRAAQRLEAGDLAGRTGMEGARGEIGKLARTVDNLAAQLQQQASKGQRTDDQLLNRTLQTTAVAALGQFALTSSDFSSLLNQAAILVTQTLEVELCWILELLADRKSMVVRAGAGWKKETVGLAMVSADRGSQAGYTLASGEAVVISDLRAETRFQSEPILVDHKVISGVEVGIGAQEKAYGALGVFSLRPRTFTSDDLQFLLAVANALAVAVERRRAESELRKLAEFARLNPNPAMEFAADGSISYFNQAALKLAESFRRRHPREFLPPDMPKMIQSCLASGQSRTNLESRVDGRVLSWSLHPFVASQVVHGYVADITERLNLEAQLRHSQKMESVGQLAAGVAHDFNNMLTVIQGHAGMFMSRPSLPPELKESAQAVHLAAERAAGLTRQLLLFSRKSVMQPTMLDLREIVSNMIKMLKRLLGETISLEFQQPAEMPLVRGDAGMIEQVIMNLAVNARDAMPFGGKLKIELDTTRIDEVYVRMHPEAQTGQAIVLRVADTGSGMDPSTLNRIFEPFFTTKEVGKGTGLGLATVYGVVKLHQGWIEVASQVGQGTAFTIYFPASQEMARKQHAAEALGAQVRGGTETILLVEDEPSVLKMGRIILQDCGYKVLEASSGMEALERWRQHPGPIDLLLTDMVMPHGMSGIELAQKLMAEKPGLKVLFTSGYNVSDLDTDFIRKGGGSFLQKPFTRFTLAKAVREWLDSPRAADRAPTAA